jgi:hypothetical protein
LKNSTILQNLEISLREINRFVKIVEFFKNYFTIKRKCEQKDEGDNKAEEDKKDLDEKKQEKKI